MIINNVELPDIDVSDALVMENYEAAHDKVAKKINNLDVNGKRRSELIRIQCEAVFEFFEDVFGEGTAKKVFGESVNLMTCINAYGEVVKAVNAADERMARQIKGNFLNRQQRRNQSKGKKKKHYTNRPQLVNNNR